MYSGRTTGFNTTPASGENLGVEAGGGGGRGGSREGSIGNGGRGGGGDEGNELNGDSLYANQNRVRPGIYHKLHVSMLLYFYFCICFMSLAFASPSVVSKEFLS